MRWSILVMTLFVGSCSTINDSNVSAKRTPASFSDSFDYSRCTKATDEDTASYIVEDLDLGEDRLEYEFLKMYKSPKRVRERVYYDQKLKQFIAPFGPQSFAIPKVILESISAHIQMAINEEYARYIFFADMGHGHIYLPKTYSYPSFGEILYAEDIKVIYHTAEMMHLGSDADRASNPYLQRRFQNRNLVGNLLTGELESVDVTVFDDNILRDLPGYKEQEIFYFRATPNGCFSYDFDGQKYYFDIRF